jgi:hypothetical protein
MGRGHSFENRSFENSYLKERHLKERRAIFERMSFFDRYKFRMTTD